jgi:hypothetical protein
LALFDTGPSLQTKAGVVFLMADLVVFDFESLGAELAGIRQIFVVGLAVVYHVFTLVGLVCAINAQEVLV